MVPADVPLPRESDDKVRRDGRVHTDEQPAHIPEDDGQVDVSEEFDLGVTVEEPEGDGDL